MRCLSFQISPTSPHMFPLLLLVSSDCISQVSTERQRPGGGEAAAEPFAATGTDDDGFGGPASCEEREVELEGHHGDAGRFLYTGVHRLI